VTGLEYALILQLQLSFPWLLIPMKLASVPGDPIFYLIIIPAVYWCRDARAGFRLAMLLAVSCWINQAAKVLLHTPRPFWTDPEVRALTCPATFGMPSGHAQVAASMLGYAGAYLRRNAVWAGLAAAVLFVGFSRIFLGVHTPADVLAGWCAGIAVLIGFLALDHRLAGRAAGLPAAHRAGLAVALSVCMLCISAFAVCYSAAWTVPADWAANAITACGEFAPYNPDAALCAGAVLGLGAGSALMDERGGFSTAGPIGQMALRYLIGMAGAGMIWVMFSAIELEGGGLTAYLLRYIQAAAWGVWISCAGPMLLIRLRLLKAGRTCYQPTNL
jgi:membrane-associated phospholipid phosphatase